MDNVFVNINHFAFGDSKTRLNDIVSALNKKFHGKQKVATINIQVNQFISDYVHKWAEENYEISYECEIDICRLLQNKIVMC